jgi:hypothetical protein
LGLKQVKLGNREKAVIGDKKIILDRFFTILLYIIIKSLNSLVLNAAKVLVNLGL